MIAATSVMTKRRTRIAKVGPVTLPQSAELVTVVSVAVGAVLGFLVSMLILRFDYSWVWCTIGGSMLGFLVVTVKPSKHYSLGRWLKLKFQHSARRRMFTRDQIQVYVGVAPVRDYPAGRIRVLSGAVDVRAEEYDMRGVRIPQ